MNFVDVSSGLIDRQIFSPARATIDTSLGGDPRSPRDSSARSARQTCRASNCSIPRWRPFGARWRWKHAHAGPARRGTGTRRWNSSGAQAFGRGFGARRIESLCVAVIAATALVTTTTRSCSRRKCNSATPPHAAARRRGRARCATSSAACGAHRRLARGARFAANGLALVLRDDEATQAESDSLFLESIAIASALRAPGDHEVLNARLNRAAPPLYGAVRRGRASCAGYSRTVSGGPSASSDLALQARVALGDAPQGERRWDRRSRVYRDAERAMRRPGNTSRSWAPRSSIAARRSWRQAARPWRSPS